MKRFSLIIISAFTAMMLVFVSTAHAEFKRNYTQAKKSFEDGKYPAAINKLQDAIKDNPESAARVKIYGMRYDSYIPHYYLGEAYFRQSDCASAMVAWEKALQAGVVQGLKEYSSMQTNMAACKVDVVEAVDVSRIAGRAKSEIDALVNANRSFANLRNENLLKQEWASNWQPELTRSEQLTQSLSQRLDSATADSDPDAIEAIINEARNGVTTISGTGKLAQAQVKALQSRGIEAERVAQDAARLDLQNTIRQAGAAQTFEDGNSQMTTLLADLQRQVTFGKGLVDTASAVNLKEQTQIIDNVLRRYSLAVQDWQAQQQNIADRTPPPTLKLIAEAYFLGDYKAVANMADPDNFDKSRARIQALLFRAAANHKLYVLSGAKQSELLGQVQSDIRAIKQMNSKFSPYIAAFSPRFLAFFQQTG